MSSGLSIASGETEAAVSSDDRHFSYGVENGIPTEDGDGAALVFTVSEGEVHGHQKPDFLLCGGGVQAL